jgi:hypothetical protein
MAGHSGICMADVTLVDGQVTDAVTQGNGIDVAAGTNCDGRLQSRFLSLDC